MLDISKINVGFYKMHITGFELSGFRHPPKPNGGPRRSFGNILICVKKGSASTVKRKYGERVGGAVDGGAGVSKAKVGRGEVRGSCRISCETAVPKRRNDRTCPRPNDTLDHAWHLVLP